MEEELKVMQQTPILSTLSILSILAHFFFVSLHAIVCSIAP